MKKNYIILVLLVLSMYSFAQLPTVCDLRDSGYVTSVKSQSGGTCWTHGTMAAIESNLFVTNAWSNNGEVGEPNLAEYHLDWWNGFNDNYNEDMGTGQGLQVHMGGDYRVSTAYLSRGEGAVRDLDAQSYDNPPDRFNSSYHYYYPRDVEWFTMDDSLNGIDEIKQQIINYGAMATCMYYDNSFIDTAYNFYQPSSSSFLPNHSVTIVGWDDNHEVPTAPHNGAWLVKNSWGDGWGLNGYFWISYYDKWSCREPDMGAVSFMNTEPLQYSKIYFHDYHGWRATKKDIQIACNAFHAREDVWLKSVSFFTDTDAVDFKIKIFSKMRADTFVNALVMQTGNEQKRGFHTVDLQVPVHLHDGDNFYIYLYLSAGGQPYDRTSDVPVLLDDTIISKSRARTIVKSIAYEGESFYFDSLWHDLYFYDDPSSFDSTGNFCIKGLAVDKINSPKIGAMFHILDYDTVGIKNASVSFNDSVQVTDKQGDVFWTDVDTNQQNITVHASAVGYDSFDTIVNIADTSVAFNIYLRKIANIQPVDNQIVISPNPTQNYITIKGENTDFSYRIYDLTGKLISSGKSSGRVDVSYFNKGFYLIEIKTVTQKQTLKFVKM